jgi:hypothetical protein
MTAASATRRSHRPATGSRPSGKRSTAKCTCGDDRRAAEDVKDLVTRCIERRRRAKASRADQPGQEVPQPADGQQHTEREVERAEQVLHREAGALRRIRYSPSRRWGRQPEPKPRDESGEVAGPGRRRTARATTSGGAFPSLAPPEQCPLPPPAPQGLAATTSRTVRTAEGVRRQREAPWSPPTYCRVARPWGIAPSREPSSALVNRKRPTPMPGWAARWPVLGGVAVVPCPCFLLADLDPAVLVLAVVVVPAGAAVAASPTISPALLTTATSVRPMVTAIHFLLLSHCPARGAQRSRITCQLQSPVPTSRLRALRIQAWVPR